LSLGVHLDPSLAMASPPLTDSADLPTVARWLDLSPRDRVRGALARYQIVVGRWLGMGVPSDFHRLGDGPSRHPRALGGSAARLCHGLPRARGGVRRDRRYDPSGAFQQVDRPKPPSPRDFAARGLGPVVIQRVGDSLAALRKRGWLVQSAALGAILLAACLAAAPVVALLHGPVGLAGSGAACGLCFLGAALGLALARCFRDSFPGAGFTIGMLPRMGIPLGGGIWLHLRGGVLAEGGIMFYLLMFYPVTLALETWLLLGASGVSTPPSEAGHPGLQQIESGGSTQNVPAHDQHSGSRTTR